MSETSNSPQTAEQAEKTPQPRKRRKGIVVGSIIAVVLIVAGAGFWVWHEQPSFCNAICHTPMDSYVDSYYADEGAEGSVVTHAKANVKCLDCHEAKIDEQVTEGIHWVSGDYVFDGNANVLESRSFATEEFCLNKNCHNMTLDELAETTSDMPWNVHNFSEHGVTDCGTCHSMHGQSTIACSECHKEATEDIPDGWTCIPYGEER